MPSNLQLKALVVAMGVAAGWVAFAARPSAVLANTSIVTQATQLRASDAVVSPMALAKSMRVTMSLKWRKQAQLKAFIANPYHQNLTHAEFVAKYGPSEAQVNQVKTFMRQQGFSNLQVTSDHLLVAGEASVATVQSAFHTNMVNVRTQTGRMAFANSSPARIPNALQDVVHEVIGLQNVHRFHVLAHTQAGSVTGHNPTEFASIYNAGNTKTASTINVGMITLGDMSQVQSDFQSFLIQNALGNIPMKVIKVDGGGTANGANSVTIDGEYDLDSQDIIGISGGVKALYLYDTNNSFTTQSLLDAISKATNDDVVRVANVAIAECETDKDTNGTATGDDIFQEAVAQGMTFSVASGDYGVYCVDGENVNTTKGQSWPADSQYVVAVGGTTLSTSGTTWAGETIWSYPNSNPLGGTSGGPSAFEAMPSWQKGVGQNAGHSTRGIPDIAFDADPNSGAVIITEGSRRPIGGTSLSSPLFVGVWARTLAANPNLGFAAPLIYQDAASHYSTDFRDVTSGSIAGGGAAAAPGWDYASGFGSIDIANFISHVAGGVSPPPPPPPPAPPTNLKVSRVMNATTTVIG